MKALIISAFLAIGTVAFAHPNHDMEKTAPNKDFETMKKLVGTWEGTGKMEGKDMPVTIQYSLTSGNTALMEKMSPGTDHEMLTVYHREGNGVGMTHYCMMDNQPHMALKKSDPHSLTFEMDKAQGAKMMKVSHMHALTLTMADNDTLKQEWTNYTDGKKDTTTVFNFKRKK